MHEVRADEHRAARGRARRSTAASCRRTSWTAGCSASPGSTRRPPTRGRTRSRRSRPTSASSRSRTTSDDQDDRRRRPGRRGYDEYATPSPRRSLDAEVAARRSRPTGSPRLRRCPRRRRHRRCCSPMPDAPSTAPMPEAPDRRDRPRRADHGGRLAAAAGRSRPASPASRRRPTSRVPVARLMISNGDVVDVDRAIVIGRAPEARRFNDTEQPRLVTVPSPHLEISSTHLEVRPGVGRRPRQRRGHRPGLHQRDRARAARPRPRGPRARRRRAADPGRASSTSATG